MKTYQPGDKGAGQRHFTTEDELAEATECPLGFMGQAWAIDGAYIDKSVQMPDGTVCGGPACPKWSAIVTDRDGKTGEITRAELCCLAGERVNAMGIIKRAVKS